MARMEVQSDGSVYKDNLKSQWTNELSCCSVLSLG